ncbi:hypothetical protein HA050_17780 [Iodobacter sp. HSC-16F04]|uniref:histidine kinase n=1 Tax=Iodobacter violaceini TaxID=3044271 RepID=A0ABX0L5R5_9NEIS|nr:ATP-binding protein [Iodobacter violacea]NHQ87963.1 hypothetical protein [Iodobacter violacea]
MKASLWQSCARLGQSLHFRIALLVIGLLLGSNIALLFLGRHYGQQASRETMQAMHRGMAQYILSNQPQPLIDDQGKVNQALMHDLMMHVMAINPAVEVYLLDAQGRILGHVLEGASANFALGETVDLRPVAPLLEKRRNVRLPVLGEDPRRKGQKNIISVAAISRTGQTGLLGYLYIVLDGQARQNLNASLQNSAALQGLWLSVLISSLLASLVLWLALLKLTQPLKRLTQKVQKIRLDEAIGNGLTVPATSSANDEISVLEQAILALNARIEAQFKRIEESDQMRRELVSNISHDLRTPLACIQGYVETVLLQADKISHAERNEFLKTAMRHIRLMEKRVMELFELSKLDSGHVLPKLEVFCLAELLHDVLQGYQLQARQAQVQLRLEAQHQMLVQADIALIERVLQNLIENALRYTPAGGAVVVSLQVSGQQVGVSIRDSGQGIAHEHLPFLFERYWRAPALFSPHHEGAGLGLAIVKRILDLHGVAIKVQSEISQGTQFSFMLPQIAKI